MLTGWPPAMLTGAPTQTYATASAPTLWISFSSLARSMSPLNGLSSKGSWAASTTTSWKVPPLSSWCSRVVVKYMFPGMCCPGLIRMREIRFSAPRPWWTGMTCSYP